MGFLSNLFNKQKIESSGQNNQSKVVPSKSHEFKGTAEKPALAKDNVGTRMDTFDTARSYWISFMTSGNIPPFVCYKFTSEQDAMRGISNLSFIKKASDTGKLITLVPTLYYGYYEIDPGKWEVLICGDMLTIDMYNEAMEKLANAGGILKDRKEPKAKKATATSEKSASASQVSFSHKEKKGESTYHIYRGPSKEAAIEFLKTLKPITQYYVYHIVETPEGNFGRDKDGIYQERT